MFPLAVVRQQAVGHGGFHTGALGSDRPQLRWAYDCGSWREAGQAALLERISELAAKGGGNRLKLDFLFLSHFDADHVNGVAKLLEKIDVETVVLPYLTGIDAFVVLAQGLLNDDCSSDLIETVIEPAVWFGRRGVERIVRLRAGPGSERPVELSPPAFEGDPTAYHPVIFDGDGAPIAAGTRPARGVAAETIANPGLTIGAVTAHDHLLDWRFVPYVHPVPAQIQQDLESKVEDLIGTSVSDPTFGKALSNYVKRTPDLKSLRKYYDAEALSDANAISLSLYVGPTTWTQRTRDAWPPGRVGWFLTGDSKLGTLYRRREWVRHYRSIPPERVHWFMLPHHGATRNMDVEVLEPWPEVQLFVTATSGDKLRPHADLKDRLREAGRDPDQIHIVTEKKCDEILEISGASDFWGHPLVTTGRWRNWT